MDTFHGRAIVGCAMGDTLGVPYEFQTPPASAEEIRQLGHCWTDDSQQSLVLLDDYLRHGDLDYRRVLDRFAQYWRHPNFPHPRGCGLHRGTGSRFRSVVQAYVETGAIRPANSSGNGAAMRIGPTAYAMPDSQSSLAQLMRVSGCTHGESIGVAASEAVALAAWSLRDGLRGSELLSAVSQRASEPRMSAMLASLVGRADWRAVIESTTAQPAGSAYGLCGPVSAIAIVANTSSTKEAIHQAILIGGDTDSTGAIAGSLAAGAFGFDDVPASWFEYPECESLNLWSGDESPADRDACVMVEERLSARRAAGKQ